MSYGMSTCETRSKIDVTWQPKIGWIKHLIGAGIMQDRFGVDTGPVGECSWSRDRHIKRNSEIKIACHQLVERGQLPQIVACQQVGIIDIQLGHQSTQRGNAVALSYTH